MRSSPKAPDKVSTLVIIGLLTISAVLVSSLFLGQDIGSARAAPSPQNADALVLPWEETTVYGTTASGQLGASGPSCVLSSGVIYCVGGEASGLTDNALFAPVSTSGIPNWIQTTPYPIPNAGMGCITTSGEIICVGGTATDATYFATLTANGIGVWQPSSPYPTNSTCKSVGNCVGNSCVGNSGYIYCIGGTADYFAQAGSDGVGEWMPTTAYPGGIHGESCAAATSQVVCVGGAIGNADTSDVYSASLGAEGIGTWQQAPAYPFAGQSQGCAISGAYLICVGGYVPGSVIQSSYSYYAQLNGGGLGAWISTTSLPRGETGLVCLVNASILYCLNGGAPYFAPITLTPSSPWETTTPYPIAVAGLSCTASGGYVYCIGGGQFNESVACESESNCNDYDVSSNTSSAYFAPIGPTGIGQWLKTTNYPIPVAGESCFTLSNSYGPNAIYCVGGNSNGQGTNATYFATISSQGIGPWSRGGDYTAPANHISCSAYDAGTVLGWYAFCAGVDYTEKGVGGSFSGAFTRLTLNPLTSDWLATTGPPPSIGSCFIDFDNWYCTGAGTDAGSVGYNSVCQEYVQSCKTPTGVWTSLWQNGPEFPQLFGAGWYKAGGESCFNQTMYAYCVGGGGINTVYQAQLSSGGFAGNWSLASSYPLNIRDQSCFANSVALYCVGGLTPDEDGINLDATSGSYFEPLSTEAATSTTTSTNSSTSSSTSTSVASSSTSTSTHSAASSSTASSTSTSSSASPSSFPTSSATTVTSSPSTNTSSASSSSISSSYSWMVALNILIFLTFGGFWARHRLRGSERNTTSRRVQSS